MGKLFKVNDNLFYVKNPQVNNNIFLKIEPQDSELPEYDKIADKLPRPIWDGHEDAIACYNKVWKIAFGNLRKANKEAGFVSNFIDTAFNGYLFMWDSSFILMFAKYGSGIFNFQKTLDNFYSHQHKDGFICREICEKQTGEQFARDDPASTGPNIMPWSEWEYFTSTGDIERLGLDTTTQDSGSAGFVNALVRSVPPFAYLLCRISVKNLVAFEIYAWQ